MAPRTHNVSNEAGRENREHTMSLVNDLELMEEKVTEILRKTHVPAEIIDARQSIIDARQHLDRAIRKVSEWNG